MRTFAVKIVSLTTPGSCRICRLSSRSWTLRSFFARCIEIRRLMFFSDRKTLSILPFRCVSRPAFKMVLTSFRGVNYLAIGSISSQSLLSFHTTAAWRTILVIVHHFGQSPEPNLVLVLFFWFFVGCIAAPQEFLIKQLPSAVAVLLSTIFILVSQPQSTI